MPSPFPGMDPYLEGSDLWQGFHNGYMHYVQADLQPRLPRGYIATLEVRIYFEPDPTSGLRRQERVPDLQLVRTGPARSTENAIPREPGARAHTLELDPVEVKEAFVSIRRAPSRELVTSIEMLSPGNKTSGGGRDEYLSKQWRLYETGASIVEIDFLRGGMNSVLVSEARLASLEPFHYMAGVFRGWEPLKCEAFTWTVRDALPEIRVPLEAGLDEVPLDLGGVYHRTYEVGAFDQLLDYNGDPNPALASEDAEWADHLLREAGLRGAADA
jgi:hypothetical protein